MEYLAKKDSYVLGRYVYAGERVFIAEEEKKLVGDRYFDELFKSTNDVNFAAISMIGDNSKMKSDMADIEGNKDVITDSEEVTEEHKSKKSTTRRVAKK